MTVQSRPRWIDSALVALITILVPVLLVLGSIRLIMTDAYLNIEYNKPDFPEDYYGFTLADRLHYAPIALRYLLGDDGIDLLGDLTLPEGGSFYNDAELQHMVDVKTVVKAAMLGLLVGCLLFVGLIALLIRTPTTQVILRRGLIGGGTLTLLILGGIVLYVLLAWDAFFTSFHNLFFAEGSWTFEYSDSLIRLFPIRFWQDAALTVGGLSAVGAILLLIIAWWRPLSRRA
jgi:integral membrane protein (TIGR01906 family)